MNNHSNQAYDALALFSGGLDSILAIKLIQAQGLRVLGLHFISPFFGHPEKITLWEETYGLSILPVDVSREFISMFIDGPRYGLGKILNPCVDCKILMLTAAKKMLGQHQASFIISGEVLGQRPMSQRIDTLNIIRRDADVKNILVRSLSARHLPPTDPEKKGIILREKLGAISGRGRKDQIRLAKKFNIDPIPTPAGGCLLTEKESARRYIPLLEKKKDPQPDDFYLANTGRQLWNRNYWLCIGRNKEDNERLTSLATDKDYIINLKFFPGPLGLLRPIDDASLPEEILESACEVLSRFSPKARQSNRKVDLVVQKEDWEKEFLIWPGQQQSLQWQEPVWKKPSYPDKTEDSHTL